MCGIAHIFHLAAGRDAMHSASKDMQGPELIAGRSGEDACNRAQ